LSCAVSRALAATNAMKSARMHSQECLPSRFTQDRRELGAPALPPQFAQDRRELGAPVLCHAGSEVPETGVQGRLESELWRPKWGMKFLAPPEIIGSESFGSPAQILSRGSWVARRATDGDARTSYE
jgi:hypothetical protein